MLSHWGSLSPLKLDHSDHYLKHLETTNQTKGCSAGIPNLTPEARATEMAQCSAISAPVAAHRRWQSGLWRRSKSSCGHSTPKKCMKHSQHSTVSSGCHSKSHNFIGNCESSTESSTRPRVYPNWTLSPPTRSSCHFRGHIPGEDPHRGC